MRPSKSLVRAGGGSFPNVLRHRARRSSLSKRVEPGKYVLREPKPPTPPKPPEPDPVRSDGTTDEQWYQWLDDWKATGEWKGVGAPPGQDGCKVPMDIIFKFTDRVRKREERRKEAKAAAARRAAADAELRDKLIAAAGGNVVRGPGIEDLAPIKAAMEFVPLDSILTSIRDDLHRLMCPTSEPATSWRERRLLKRIAADTAGRC
jgi:hypothetical protein